MSTSEWMGDHSKKNMEKGVWKDTEKTGRDQEDSTSCQGIDIILKNGKPQKILKQDSDGMRFIFCKYYSGSYMDELENNRSGFKFQLQFLLFIIFLVSSLYLVFYLYFLPSTPVCWNYNVIFLFFFFFRNILGLLGFLFLNVNIRTSFSSLRKYLLSL